MSGTDTHEQPEGAVRPAGANGQVAGRERRGRRRLVTAAVVIVVVLAAGVVAAGAAGAFRGRGSPSAGAAGSGYRTSTATVTRQTLTSQTYVSATLGDAGSYSVVNQATGTVTWLPAVGDVIRQGQVLYRVSGSPVVLLYGKVPAYRALSEGMTGRDVRQLNHDLVALGYATAAGLAPLDYYGAETAYALERLQAHLGVAAPEGTLALGAAVFLPTPAKITALSTGVVPGVAATPASVVLSATSTVPVVTIKLNADQQTEVKAGDRVSITLPNGTTTAGVVSSVGTVATTNSSGTTTVTVLVALSDRKVAGQLDQAPVTVAITTTSVRNVLVVPVTALLARASGGYAVEVTGPRGHHLVPVTPGLFDDAAGLVQVSGAGLAPGQHVVVPAV